MDAIRKYHNDAKRDLIQSTAREGQSILDVGSGFGGDLQKWRSTGVNINMCEPSQEALHESKTRAKNLRIRVNFYHGDISVVPKRRYDIICYNFSLQYIFASKKLFLDTTKLIADKMKVGGSFIGIIPDSEKIIFNTPINHETGSFFIMKNTSSGEFGEKLFVNLEGTPYYADGAKPEPIAHKDLLVTRMEKLGFRLHLWEPLCGNPISNLYAKFIFVYKL